MNDSVKTPRMSGKWRWVLGVSLALNVAFVGLVAGGLLREHGPRGGGREAAQMRGFGLPYVRSLAPEQRRAIIREVRSSGRLPDRAERRATYTRMIEALRTTPFDTAAAAAILEEQGTEMTGARVAAQEAWLTVVTQMSETDRATYADRLAERLDRGFSKRK